MLHVTSFVDHRQRLVSLPESGYSLLPWMLIVPPLAAGLASSGVAAWTGVVIGATWSSLMLVAFYVHKVGLLMPLCSGLFFAGVLVLLPFNSAAFVIEAWTTLLMLLLTFPRRRPAP
jgi:hypothetical protein